MKLRTRRAIRQWLLDAPRGTAWIIGIALAGVMAAGVRAGDNALAIAGMLALLGFVFVRGKSMVDACTSCRSKVHVTDERYCSTCGHYLDDLPASPPIDERVDERHRPVGLNEIERTEPAPARVADGGERRDDT